MNNLLEQFRNTSLNTQKTRATKLSISLGLSALLFFSGCSPSQGAQTDASINPNLEILSVQIIADPNDWQGMLDTATQENYIKADVIVNGTTYKNVGIRPKGNSSLRQVAQMAEGDQGVNRYSFRIKFDEYVEGQTCLGVNTLVLNNMISDNTYLKEYLSYDIMKTIGVKTPLFNFSNVLINGESWGLYLAVEVYNDSYENRVYGHDEGMLYNVKMSVDRNQDQDQDPNKLAPGTAKNMNNASGSLVYTDDLTSSYSAIFDNVVGSGSEEDYQRVIAAIKALDRGEDLEEYFDVDAILRYLAAHTVVVNLDSYSSNMAQNYYIYESEGKITVLPWDYNMAWGGFETKDASTVVNFPIDTPVSNVSMEERPLISKLLSIESYKAQYHLYLGQILDQYFNNGLFESKIDGLSAQIDIYAKEDAHAFCSYEDYKKAIISLKKLGTLRAKSIQGQLNGTIPATHDGQAQNTDSRIDASSIDIADLGSMMGAGNMGGMNRPPMENMPDRETMEKAFKIIEESGGKIDEKALQQLKDLGLKEEQIDIIKQRPH